MNKNRRKEVEKLIDAIDNVVCQYGVTIQAVGPGGIPVGPDLRKSLEEAVEYLAYFLAKSK